MKVKVGLVDDHQLFLKSLSLMLESFDKYEVVIEAVNGKDIMEKLKAYSGSLDVLLVDVNMPVMDGVETAKWVNESYPLIKMIALSMNDQDTAIIAMFKAGCSAYLLKDAHPTELEKALAEVNAKGYYNADLSNIDLRRLLMKSMQKPEIVLTHKEMQFLQFACTELTYKQIAVKMELSERTVDGYREALFQKFHVQSRVGLCLEAIRKGFVTI